MSKEVETTQIPESKLVAETVKKVEVRIWKLGNLDHHIKADPAVIERLTNILKRWDGKSNLDIVWDSCIGVEVFEVCADGVDAFVGDLGGSCIKRGNG